MSATECMKTVLASQFDVFLWGALLGGLLVVLMRTLETYFKNKFLIDQKKMDIYFGEYLLTLKERVKNHEVAFGGEKKVFDPDQKRETIQ